MRLNKRIPGWSFRTTSMALVGALILARTGGRSTHVRLENGIEPTPSYRRGTSAWRGLIQPQVCAAVTAKVQR